ncbi:hypothetical protein, partial [Fictibacillus phosphorivorans]|uniref:hypothetical protein n=1 Tax=Fictibacillus phosphorivorans TaxID=1221500 RepID=UPI002040AE3D
MHDAYVAGKWNSNLFVIQKLTPTGVSAICVGISAKLRLPPLTAWSRAWLNVTPRLTMTARLMAGPLSSLHGMTNAGNSTSK